MKPRWMRNHIACPDCGIVLHIHGAGASFVFIGEEKVFMPDFKDNSPWDCPRCKCHYSNRDFWEEQSEKWDRTANLEEE